MNKKPSHLLTPRQLRDDLEALGVVPGQTVMLHGSVKAVGAMMGGPNEILSALFGALSSTGTLMMYAGWEDFPDTVQDQTEEEGKIFQAEYPAFTPASSRAVRENSILAEFLRTWPGSQRSLNPEASMVACGRQARYLTEEHPLDYGYGVSSPLEKLIQIKGNVLLLGSPLGSITLLHYAENRAKLAHKDVVRYRCPVLRDGQRLWINLEDYNTGKPHADYSFEQITLAYLGLNRAKRGKVGNAESFLFDARDLADFAVRWLEERFS